MPDGQHNTTEAHARQLWATLASNGKPPGGIADARNTLPRYSVGIDGWLDRLAGRYLRDLCLSAGHFKLVLAPYGGGKTHFLLALGARALHENFAVSYVACAPGVSVENPFDLYRETFRRLSLPGSPNPGPHGLLDRVLRTKRREISERGAPDPEIALDRWIASIGKTTWPERTFGRVMAAALREAKGDEASPEGEAAIRWLDGEIDTLDRQERSALKLARIPSGDKKRFGRDMLWSLIRFAPHADVRGLALLLDEVETLTNVRGKALDRVLAAIRAMIDAPGIEGSIPLFGVFAATPDILEQLPRYPALQMRLAVSGSAFHEHNDYASQLDLAHIQDQRTLLADIGRKLIDVGRDATGHEFDAGMQSANATALAEVASQRNLDVDARRLYVKTWVGLLEYQKNNGEQRFTDDELDGRYEGSFDELRRAGDEDDEP